MRILLSVIFALNACGGAMPQDPSPTPDRGGGRSTDDSAARDGDLAVREEFAAAEADGSDEAYLRFAARHPDHPLAAEARERAAAP